MRIRLLQHQRIAADGINVKWHKTGEVLDLPEPLATALIRDRLAENPDALPEAVQPKVVIKPGKKQEYSR